MGKIHIQPPFVLEVGIHSSTLQYNLADTLIEHLVVLRSDVIVVADQKKVLQDGEEVRLRSSVLQHIVQEMIDFIDIVHLSPNVPEAMGELQQVIFSILIKHF